MAKEIICCNIEHHAMLFAFLAKHAITLCGEAELGTACMKDFTDTFGQEYLDATEGLYPIRKED